MDDPDDICVQLSDEHVGKNRDQHRGTAVSISSGDSDLYMSECAENLERQDVQEHFSADGDDFPVRVKQGDKVVPKQDSYNDQRDGER